MKKTRLVRWPNGDVSIVVSRTKSEQDDLLDQVGDPTDPNLQYREIDACAIHFGLNLKGQLFLQGVDEQTSLEIDDWAYPLIRAAWDAAAESIDNAPTDKELARAVRKEKRRLWKDRPKSTEELDAEYAIPLPKHLVPTVAEMRLFEDLFNSLGHVGDHLRATLGENSPGIFAGDLLKARLDKALVEHWHELGIETAEDMLDPRHVLLAQILPLMRTLHTAVEGLKDAIGSASPFDDDEGEG